MWNDLVPAKAPLTRTGVSAWLMSFIDLLSILLCTFVLLFSLTALDMAQWDTFRGSFQGIFAGMPEVTVAVADGRKNAERTRPPLTDGLKYLDSVLRRKLDGDAAWGGLRGAVDREAGTLTYVMPAALTQADWQRLGGALRNLENPIRLVVKSTPAQVAAAMVTAQAAVGVLKDQDVDKLEGVFWVPLKEAGQPRQLMLVVKRGQR